MFTKVNKIIFTIVNNVFEFKIQFCKRFIWYLITDFYSFIYFVYNNGLDIILNLNYCISVI